MRDQLPQSEILIVAAEASSELYARRIIDECNNRKLNIKFFGIGSQAMEAMGVNLVENSEKMAVVGLFEVIAHWSVIAGAFKKLLLWAKDRKPKLALLLDYPDFNLRLAKKLNGLKIPVVYFISPQVWAWRTGRVHLIKKIVSRMLVVFPFEKEFYEKFNVPVSFVGHPLLDEIKSARLSEVDRQSARGHIGVVEKDFLVGLLPGSRESELKYNFLSQIQAAQILAEKYPQCKFLILVAPTLELERLKELLPPDLKVNVRLVKDEPLKVMQMCDACVVASGTATLMMGLAETPMVIMYKMNAMTGFLARYLVKGQFFGMANLILGKQAVPELFQESADGPHISRELGRYIDDPSYRSSVKEKLAQIKTKLGSGGAVGRVVDELEKYFKP